jgi:predicted NBD/HSP70 family sugar kinase
MRLLDEPRLGKTAEHIKRTNRRTVLDLIRAGDGPSRADLARMTGMSPQSISNIIADLEAANLIRPDGRLYGAKGQPPVAYRIDPDGAAAIGIHLDRGHLRGVLLDGEFTMRAARERTLGTHRAPAIYAAVRDLARDLAAAHEGERSPLWGVGVASPRLQDGRVIDSFEGSPWEDLRAAGFDQHLAEDLGLPVVVENDANAGALGEANVGGNRLLETFCYLFVGRGLGSGSVQQRRLYRGAWRNAGEIGRVPLPPSIAGDERASIVEQMLSVDALLARLQAPPQGRLIRVLEDFPVAAPGELQAWIAAAAPVLRWTVALLEHVYDPETIIVGSYLPRPMLDQLLASAEPLLPSISVREGRRVPRLQAGALGHQAIAIGAAIAPLLALAEPEPDSEWAICGPIPDVYAPRLAWPGLAPNSIGWN